MPGVLIISGSDGFRTSLTEALGGASCHIAVARDPLAGRQCVQSHRPDVVVVESQVAEEDMWEILAAVRQADRGTEVILCTGAYTTENAVLAFKKGARDFLAIPVDIASLADSIHELLDRREPSPHYLARRLDRYIRKNLSDCNLTLTSVCQRFGISASYASKLFNRRIGMSFRRRLRQHRLIEARRLLRGTDEPIYLIADSCGFRSQGRLSEALCRTEGVPPRRFRELARGDLEL